MDWAKDVLARVIQKSGENLDAPFATEALEAAAILAEQDLGTFVRYRQNLKKRHISITVLDEGLRRLKTRHRAASANAAAAPSGGAPRAQGQELKLPEPQPWPTPVFGATLLDELSTTIHRYMAMEVEAVHSVALWIVFTHLLDAFEISPYLAVTSPTHRCGKTRLFRLLLKLVFRPVATANITAAATFRVIDAHAPTLLIDELDSFVARNDEFRGIIDSAHSRETARVIRTVGDREPRVFSTWSALALGLIGKLPETIEDRSLPIRMKRKKPSEEVERLNLRDPATQRQLHDLARKVARWAADNRHVVARAQPKLPGGLDDRALDIWEPMVSIADQAGGEWPKIAREAAIKLSAGRDNDDTTLGGLLLHDIRGLFEERKVDRITSEDLVKALLELEARPWPECPPRGRPISKNRVADLLRPFGVGPASIDTRIPMGNRKNKTAKGYQRKWFDDAFERYLQPGNGDTKVDQ